MHLIRRDWLVVTLQSIYGLGVAQRAPPVPLVRVGLGQRLQLVRQVLVVVVPLGLGGLGTHPLPRQAGLRCSSGGGSISSSSSGVGGGGGGGGRAGLALCTMVPSHQCIQVTLGHTVLIPVVAFLGLC